MPRLINAFAIELAVPFVFLWVNVPLLCVATVYVRLFRVSFRTIKEKKTSLFLIVYSQCASLN